VWVCVFVDFLICFCVFLNILMCGFLQLYGVCVIPNELLCISSLPVSKHHRTPFQFHYSLLSTAHSVPTNGSNKTANVLVTLRSVRATFVIVDSSKFCIFSVCIYRLKYPACNAHGRIVIWCLPSIK